MSLPISAIAQPKENIEVPDEELTLLTPERPQLNSVATTTPVVLCNCWAYVKSKYPGLPGTDAVLSNLSRSGSVAVFFYSKTSLYHYAIVLYETDTKYVIEETNYSHCKKGKREVLKTDSTLIGFYKI